MKNTKMTLALLSAGLSVALLTGCDTSDIGGGDDTPAVQIHPYDAPPISEYEKGLYLNAVNAARAVARDCGRAGYKEAVPPLVWNDGAYRAAYEHSEDLVVSGIPISHYGSGTNSDWTAIVMELGRQSTPDDRIRNNLSGYIDATSKGVGENVAEGHTDTNQVINAWLGSDTHCRNIMDPYMKEFGMARVDNTWTQVFAELSN